VRQTIEHESTFAPVSPFASHAALAGRPVLSIFSDEQTLVASITSVANSTGFQAAWIASAEGVYTAQWTVTASAYPLTERFTFNVVRTRRGEV